MSKEVINILDALCEKFGIVIDWTSANVIPYLQELCGKFIKWEIATSIAWIVIGIIIAIISIIILKADLEGMELFFFVIGMAAAVVIIGTNTFDIIECCTFPEKVIYDYVRMHVNT